MFINSGFTFKNIKGTYKISSTQSNDYRRPGYEDVIVSTYEFGYNAIYTNGNADEESVALKFAAIDINKEKEILDFCNTYGLLFTNSIDYMDAESNDYLFLDAPKDDIVLGKLAVEGSCISLDAFKASVIEMRSILELFNAVTNEDLPTIARLLLFFCLDPTDYDLIDDDTLEPMTESLSFNDKFFEYLQIVEDEHEPDECDTLHKKISLFLKDVEDDLYETEMSDPGYHYHAQEYPDMYHSTWQQLHTLFSNIINEVTIVDIDPLTGVELSSPIDNSNIERICPNKEYTLKLAKAFLADFFNAKLSYIRPEMTIENGQFLPNLRINSLEDAMYLELFFRFTPYTRLRQCANPTCNAFFEVSTDNSKKIYCSTRCAQLMAKRKQRQREKIK